MIKKYHSILTILLLAVSIHLTGQNTDSSNFYFGFFSGDDTIIHYQLDEITIYPRVFNNRRQEKRYWKNAEKVKKVYPYALMVNEILAKYEPEYIQLETNKEKRQLVKQVEDELLLKYKDELKKLTVSEGKILIKLIDRETSRTSYKIIREFRGGLTAFFWQSIARLFGNDLKAVYDPYGEDRELEEIITLLEYGYI